MALETEKRFTGVEQILIDRTMRIVTVQAVLGYIGMLIEKGTPFLRVALDTGLLDGVLLQVGPGKAAVRIVTVDAKNPPLIQGMMAQQGKFDPGRFMAGKTELAGRHWRNLQIWAGVNIVTAETGDLAHRMRAGVPVMQIKGCIGGMAFQTDQRLRRSGQL